MRRSSSPDYSNSGGTLKVKFINLGCSKNLVDSERIAGLLREADIEITEDEGEAENLVINTCAFIEDARIEAVETILEAVRWKRMNGRRRLFVVGCLPQRYRSELLEEVPEIDGLFDVGDYGSVIDAIKGSMINGERSVLPRYTFSATHYRYLRIADGCDRNCSYCAIPLIRGRYTSRPMDELLFEAESLVAEGAREIIVIAQELNSYGSDLGDGSDLIKLLRRLVEISGVEWVRMLYLHPPLVKRELIEFVAEQDKLCAYFDFPIEHISDRILKLMNRRIDRIGIEKCLRLIRDIIPQAAIRTSIMVGFPGESEDEFGELEDFISEGWFDHLGVFAFSPEKGTRAFNFRDWIPADVAAFRRDSIMEVQRIVSRERNERRVGGILRAIVDEDRGEYSIARLAIQAPEVDGVVFLPGGYRAGDFLEVKLVSASDYDFNGIVI